MADVLVDDHLLLSVLLDEEPPGLRPDGGRVWTTGLWYHRLCRALVAPVVEGQMSGRLNDVEPVLARAAVGALLNLPDDVGLVSLRSLAWPMASLLADGVRLNLLSLEALAAAEHLNDVEICLAPADLNDPLLAASERRGVSVRVVG